MHSFNCYKDPESVAHAAANYIYKEIRMIVGLVGRLLGLCNLKKFGMVGRDIRHVGLQSVEYTVFLFN